MNGRQSSVSGIFELKIGNPASKDLTGTARTTADEEQTKLDAAFHATLGHSPNFPSKTSGDVSCSRLYLTNSQLRHKAGSSASAQIIRILQVIL